GMTDRPPAEQGVPGVRCNRRLRERDLQRSGGAKHEYDEDVLLEELGNRDQRRSAARRKQHALPADRRGTREPQICAHTRPSNAIGRARTLTERSSRLSRQACYHPSVDATTLADSAD